VTRTIAETTALVTSRERRFAEHGISSMTAYRLLRGAGNFTDDHYGDVFLLVDDSD
jgi:DNA segregation ATPase FtsK/SpoIIIE, S-DNA-T family